MLLREAEVGWNREHHPQGPSGATSSPAWLGTLEETRSATKVERGVTDPTHASYTKKVNSEICRLVT